jgi:hypothetical protein
MPEIHEVSQMNINPYFLEGVGDPPVWAAAGAPDYRYMVNRDDDSRKRMPTGWTIDNTDDTGTGAVIFVYDRNIPSFEPLTHTLPPGAYNFLSINSNARARAVFTVRHAGAHRLSFYHGTDPSEPRSNILITVRGALYPHQVVFSRQYTAERAFTLHEVPISLAQGSYALEAEMAPESAGVPCIALLQVGPQTDMLPRVRFDSPEAALSAETGSAFAAMQFTLFDTSDVVPERGLFPGTPVKFEVTGRGTGTYLDRDPYLTAVRPADCVEDWGRVHLPSKALTAGFWPGVAELSISVLLQRYVRVASWPLQIVQAEKRAHLSLIRSAEQPAINIARHA